MRMTKSLLLGISTLALATGAAFAGEDSTQRWHGTGAEYHETVGGLNLFSDADAVGADEFSEPVITEAYDVYYIYPAQSMSSREMSSVLDPRAQSDAYDVYYIYPVEVESMTLVPSIDTESPQG